MKKFIVLLVALLLWLPFAHADKILGTAEKPLYAKEKDGTIQVKGYDADYNEVTAEITVKVVGELGVTAAYKKIQESSIEEIRGPKFFVYKVLLTASNISGGKSIIIDTDYFKVYDTNKIETKVLTTREEVELLEGFGAYIYIGFRTPDSFGQYLVFDKSLWFDVLFLDVIKE